MEQWYIGLASLVFRTQATLNFAEDGPNGGKVCPDCGEEVNVAPGQGPRDWDVDHQPKWGDRDPSGLDRRAC